MGDEVGDGVGLDEGVGVVLLVVGEGDKLALTVEVGVGVVFEFSDGVGDKIMLDEGVELGISASESEDDEPNSLQPVVRLKVASSKRSKKRNFMVLPYSLKYPNSILQ